MVLEVSIGPREVSMPSCGYGTVGTQMTIDSIAQAVRVKWNAVQPKLTEWAEMATEIEKDIIWQSLGNLTYPWRIGVMERAKVGLCAPQLVEFKIRTEPDRKRTACVLSIMAYLLREESREHAIAVMDTSGRYGFSVRHLGRDDIEIQELFPPNQNA